MNRKVKMMYKHLERQVGEHNAGLLLAIVCDAFDDFVKDAPEGRMLRSIEVKLNDFFSTKFNCIKGEYEN